MKTLKQLLDERSLDTELAIHAVKEWLEQKRQKWHGATLEVFYLEVIEDLLKNLEELDHQC
jgi:hypothetical protein